MCWGMDHRIRLLFCVWIFHRGILLDGVFAEEKEISGQSGLEGRMRQYREGDVLIACAFGLHESGDDGNCGERDYHGVEAVETVNMIVDQINADDSLLRGLKLGTLMVDTCSSPKHALEMLFSEILPFVSSLNATDQADINSNAILAGVIGAAYSTISMQMANSLQVFSVPQVSHWSTSPRLSDKERYPYFFRTVPSDSDQADAVLALAKQMGWNYISVVYQDDYYGQHAFADIKQSAPRESICIATSFSVKKMPSDQLAEEICQDVLNRGRAKVVALLTSSMTAQKLISTCHSLSPNDHSLLWIATDGWATFLPKDGDTYQESLEGAIGLTPEIYRLSSVDYYMTNITLKQRQGPVKAIDPWFADYVAWKNTCSLTPNANMRRCSGEERLDPETFRTHGSLHNVANAVLAFAHALDSYHRDVCAGEPGLCPAMAQTAGSNEVAKALYGYLKNVNFPAMNGGTFRFDKNQDGPPIYDILTYGAGAASDPSTVHNGWTFAGRYSRKGSHAPDIVWQQGKTPEKASTTLSTCSEPCDVGEATVPDNQMCCWHCQPCPRLQYVSWNTSVCETCGVGRIPNSTRDGCQSIPVSQMSLDTPYAIASFLAGSFGIGLTLIISGIFFKHRDTPVVRASEKELCFFVLIGVFLTFITCFPISMPASVLSCAASRFLLAMGPVWMYAGMLIKTVHTSVIFNSKNTFPSRIEFLLKYPQQIFTAMFVVFMQVFILIIWFSVDAPTPTLLYPNEETAFSCCGGLVEVRMFIALIYPFLLIAVCTILATKNRKIPTGFKESHSLGFLMHTTCVIWIAFIPIFLSNYRNIPAKMMTISLCLGLSAAAVLLCLFVPKCYVILFQPRKNTAVWVMSPYRDEGRNALTDTLDGGDSGPRSLDGAGVIDQTVRFSRRSPAGGGGNGRSVPMTECSLLEGGAGTTLP